MKVVIVHKQWRMKNPDVQMKLRSVSTQTSDAITLSVIIPNHVYVYFKMQKWFLR